MGALPYLTPVLAIALSFNQRLLGSSSGFPETWIPLASVYELDGSRPNAVSFMGNSYVCYQSQEDPNVWVVVDNTCPHRLAPLSEGRINERGLLECSYHGWAFNSNGKCAEIPQADDNVFQAAVSKPQCHVRSYPVIVHKSIVWAWLWSHNATSDKHWVRPENMLNGGLPDEPATFTRDLPYGWDTLLENIVDPAHVPWAHHGLQGSRDDAIAINMTKPIVQESGFAFEFSDRTMGMKRHGVATFLAPYVIQYAAVFETPNLASKAPTFNLTTVMIPTRPGWSRIIILSTRPRTTAKDKSNPHRKRLSWRSRLATYLPTWFLHMRSNAFLDSDLVFLHYQEQERQHRKYFMPASADRCVVAMQQWVHNFAQCIAAPPPSFANTRSALFDRWSQHVDSCRHCHAALGSVLKLQIRAIGVMATSALFVNRHVVAKIMLTVSILSLAVLKRLEFNFRQGG